MGLVGLFLAAVVSVPPGEAVVDHSQPAHWAQPTIQRFERREEDQARESNWQRYCQDLEDLWKEYRRAGSTLPAWRAYKWKAAQAKRRYVYDDPYLAPVTDNFDYEKP